MTTRERIFTLAGLLPRYIRLTYEWENPGAESSATFHANLTYE